jgi:hypothetical protein
MDGKIDQNEWIITVKGPITDALQASLRNSLALYGAALGSYMPHDSFMVTGRSHSNDAFASSLSSIAGVRHIQPLTAVSKVSRQLTKLLVTLHQYSLSTQSVNDDTTRSAPTMEEVHRLRVHVSHENADVSMLQRWNSAIIADGFTQTTLLRNSAHKRTIISFFHLSQMGTHMS